MAGTSEGATPVGTLGVGYNTFLSSARSQMVDVKYADIGHSAESNVYICTSTEDLYRSLGIKTDIAVGSPWGSFKSKMDFSSGLQSHSMTMTILVIASKIISSLTANSVGFIDPNPISAIDLFNTGGDSYVSSITMGGQYIASYNFVAHDESSFQQLTASVHANFKGTISKFDANFETSISNIQKTENVESSFNQKAIGWSKTPFPSSEDFTKFVLDFNNVPLDGPEVIDFETESYRTVKGSPDFKQIDTYRTAYVNPTFQALGYSDKLLQAKTYIPLINDVAKIYGYYDMQSVDNNLITFPKDLQYMISQIAGWLEDVDKDPTDPKIPPPDIQEEFLKIPTAQYGITMGERAGGSGGDFFQDVTPEDIEWGIFPKILQFQGSGYLDSITTTYAYRDPKQGGFSRKHGGDGGESPEVINLGLSGNVMTYLSATWGEYVDKMTTATSLNPTKVTYPNNGNGDHVTEWQFPKNSVFIGWSGSAGEYIDSILPLFATFSPCIWTTPKRR